MALATTFMTTPLLALVTGEHVAQPTSPPRFAVVAESGELG
jgi:hypothetical protein